MSAETQHKQRANALTARRSMSPTQRNNASQAIANQLFRTGTWYSATNVACYFSTHDEVETSGIFDRAWSMGKHIFAPVVGKRRQLEFKQITRESELRLSRFGLWEPIDGRTIECTSLDIVITPVVAFDGKLLRIGMGGGYYDRNFRHLAHRRHYLHPKLIGIAFDCQEVLKIKANPWDIRLYSVVTESGIRRR